MNRESFLRAGLIIISALICVAVCFLFGKVFTFTAAVTEFLLIAGCTHAVAAFLAVILWCAGVGKAVFLLRTHKITLLLIIRLMIKTTIYIVGFYNVYKSAGVKFFHLFYENFRFCSGDNGVEHTCVFAGIAACSIETGCRMAG